MQLLFIILYTCCAVIWLIRNTVIFISHVERMDFIQGVILKTNLSYINQIFYYIYYNIFQCPENVIKWQQPTYAECRPLKIHLIVFMLFTVNNSALHISTGWVLTTFFGLTLAFRFWTGHVMGHLSVVVVFSRVDDSFHPLFAPSSSAHLQPITNDFHLVTNKKELCKRIFSNNNRIFFFMNRCNSMFWPWIFEYQCSFFTLIPPSSYIYIFIYIMNIFIV